jgi:hypothetical protein
MTCQPGGGGAAGRADQRRARRGARSVAQVRGAAEADAPVASAAPGPAVGRRTHRRCHVTRRRRRPAPSATAAGLRRGEAPPQAILALVAAACFAPFRKAKARGFDFQKRGFGGHMTLHPITTATRAQNGVAALRRTHIRRRQMRRPAQRAARGALLAWVALAGWVCGRTAGAAELRAPPPSRAAPAHSPSRRRARHCQELTNGCCLRFLEEVAACLTAHTPEPKTR